MVSTILGMEFSLFAFLKIGREFGENPLRAESDAQSDAQWQARQESQCRRKSSLLLQFRNQERQK